MKREIKEQSYTVKAETVTFTDDNALFNWLSEKMKRHHLTWLLAHAYDGVIWGKMRQLSTSSECQDKQLALSHEPFPEVSPPLRLIAVQQVRLFGEQAELFLWRDGDGAWRMRLVSDTEAERTGWCFDEPQLQWGLNSEGEEEGFTLVAEGREGLRHAVPLSERDIPFDKPAQNRPDRWHPLRLGVRHYLQKEENGMLRIVQSRLTGLWVEPRKEHSNE
jgi:CRISPR-associated protein (TIGR03984 family)